MKATPRIYDTILTEQLSTQRQMALVSGPRQVGKTTACQNHASTYLNWDNLDDREVILSGPAALAEHCNLNQLAETPPVILFDELHKHAHWKQLLKGFFDTYGDRARIIVTGSSRLDTYRRVGDSLMGRYFLYHMHPFSVAEVGRQDLPDPDRVVRDPMQISEADFDALWTHGGYPEVFLKRDNRFSRRWQTLRHQQLLREDVRDLTRIQQLDQLEMLVHLLSTRSSEQIVYSNLAKTVRVSIDTIRHWIDTLCSLHHGFLIRPWFRNVSRSLRKEPKWFLRDWSGISDPGQRAETFIACHLFKAVEGWNDLGLGQFQLGYLRDKEKNEIDFVVVRDGQPWFLAEVKLGKEAIRPTLGYFQKQLNAPMAFQIVLDMEYVNRDCFMVGEEPIAVPARTFLSQLL